MKVLVIGGGGREHALVWKLRNSRSVQSVFATPGNPGIALLATCFARSDYVKVAADLDVGLTIVGPEAPLVAGIVDQFRAHGLPIVGPTAENALLEGSKVHAKQFMRTLGIPTARFEIAATQRDGLAAISRFRFPLVLKTNGLAAGKGVVIAQTLAEAETALQNLAFPVVLEEFLEGDEVSFIALCDGKRAVPLEPSQDHKRVYDGDRGPNTGGMGAYSDSRILSAEERSRILDTVILPVVEATHFTGFLYAGLMMTTNGPSVLEFNVRLGDPETQPLMMRLENDWGEVLMAAARGSLDTDYLDWSAKPATCVVLASAGYPGVPQTGVPIEGLTEVTDAVVFHAGTRQEDSRIVTSGGRVLGVTASGEDPGESIQRAYAAVERIHFDGMHYRKDIGRKGLERYNKAGSGT